MNHCTTSAVVLRRREYGDYDLIVNVLTREHGRRTLIAKAAKKSIRRFPGILEPFTDLRIVFRTGRRKGSMPVLEEATLVEPYEPIRKDIIKTAYASYWVELIASWIEEEQPRPDLHELLSFVLKELCCGNMSEPLLSIIFQMRFIGQEGLRPVLENCSRCRKEVAQFNQQRFEIDLSRGGIVCNRCSVDPHATMHLSRGTLKQLEWVADGPLVKGCRVRFDKQALSQATAFLEAFVPFHIGRMPNSLSFLKQVRNGSMRE